MLQRIFTTFTAHSSTSTSPVPTVVANLWSQLLLPQNQSVLIQWLQQGAGKQALAQLLQQSTQADGPLKQWLQEMPADKREEFKALLKLAAEQRLALAAKEPTVRDPSARELNIKDSEQTLLQLNLLQPNGRELKLSVERDPYSGAKNKAGNRPQWTIKLALPVGQHDVVHAAAIWDQHKLVLGFETENAHLLKRTESLSPLLYDRLAVLGIRCEPATFKVRQPNAIEQKVEGLSILV
ncbi:hypothetical protein MD588_05235 [Photobacterium sp. SDRW27]|uniref:hypothetical protein n=1 Tax=Photobacterium obscurum TaxID=2829490 RepID=UPI002244280F|nr:hypothetical protein [Photobacterium obscurum]MCW8328206.1 hypothetical protein [Photobacterium obscurum]